MKKFFCTVLLLSIWKMSSFAQSSPQPILKKVAWYYDVGLGFQSYDPVALKASLRANNYSSDLSSSLFMINYGVGAVFFDKLSVGINIETGTTSDFVRSGTSVSLGKVGLGLKLGYDVWSTKKHRIGLFYQLGADVNILSLDDDIRSASDFGTALDQRTSHALVSGNRSNRFLARYDYLFEQKQDQKGVVTPAVGIELGYTVAGKNSWDDITNGPEIDNSGLFVNFVFSARSKKYKKVKNKP